MASEPLDSAGLVQAVRSETESTWRVYVKEWFMSWDGVPEDAVRRFYPEDVQLSESTLVAVRRWNVKGQWKTRTLAEEQAERLRKAGLTVEVVARNSRREHVLRDYGKLLLKADSKGHEQAGAGASVQTPKVDG